jgi:hypothetical protein
MQQIDMVQWALVKQPYDQKIGFNTICLFKKYFQATIDVLQGIYVALVDGKATGFILQVEYMLIILGPCSSVFMQILSKACKI